MRDGAVVSEESGAANGESVSEDENAPLGTHDAASETRGGGMSSPVEGWIIYSRERSRYA